MRNMQILEKLKIKLQFNLFPMKRVKTILTTLVWLVVILFFTGIIAAKAGSLTPSAVPGSTMNSLEDVFNALAGTYDSSAQSADIDGNITQQLKHIAGLELQNIYNSSSPATITTTDNKNVIFSLADTATDSDFIVDMLGAGNTFEVRDDGTAVLTLADGGQATFTGNIDATGGLDVSGGALTIANQAITQTTGGQVTFAGNVDANAGLDISGANLTAAAGEFAVANTTGSITINDDGDLGQVSIEGTVLDIDSLTFVNAGSIATSSNNNLTLLPNGTGITVIGDAGSTSHTLNTNDDLLVAGRLEVDGTAYFDDTTTRIDMGTLSADNQKGIVATVSADTDGETVYGMYNNVNVGSGTLATGDRYAYGIYNDITSDSLYAGGNYNRPIGVGNKLSSTTKWAIVTGIKNLSEATETLGEEGAHTGVSNSFAPTSTTSGGNLYGVSNTLDTSNLISGNVSAKGVNNVLSGIGSSATSTLYGTKTSIRTEAGDTGYVLYIDNGFGWSTGGTQYGLYSDFSDTDVTYYPIYEASNLGNNILYANTRIGSTDDPTNTLSVAGSANLSGDLSLDSGGTINTTSDGNLTLLPDGTGITVVGDAGATSHTLNTNDDLFVSGRLEVDGVSYFDEMLDINIETTTASDHDYGFKMVHNLNDTVNGIAPSRSYDAFFINVVKTDYDPWSLLGTNSLFNLQVDGSSVFKVGLDDGYAVTFSNGATLTDNGTTFSIEPASGDYTAIGAGTATYITAFHEDSLYVTRDLEVGADTYLSSVDIANTITLTSGGNITTTSNGSIILNPDGSGITNIGSGSTSHTLNTNDDLLVAGRLEVDEDAYFDKNVLISDDRYLELGGLQALAFKYFDTEAQSLMFLGADSGRQLVLGNLSNQDFDHALQTNPTLFIHSVLDPDTSNNQWGSFSHDQENFVISTGDNTGAGTGATTDNNGVLFELSDLTSGGTANYGMSLTRTLNDSGAAGGSDLFTGFLMDITTTDITGWDNVYLMDLQDDSTSKFLVDILGNVTATGVINANGGIANTDAEDLAINANGAQKIILAGTSTGAIDLTTNTNALAGLDVSGAGLTITNQVITQTTGGQVTFAGNVNADGGLDVTGAITGDSDVDFTFAGSENLVVGNTTNTLGAAGGMLDLSASTATADTRTLNIATYNTATTGNTAYSLYNTLTSSAVVTGTNQNLYGSYNTVTKTGADTSTDTTTLYGTYSTASNTGSTDAGTKKTYGGYFTATGDTNGTATAIGLYASASGADTNYAVTIANDNYIGAVDNAGTSYIDMFKVNTDDEIQVGAPFVTGSFEFAEDAGFVTAMDLSVSATPAAGTEESYAFSIDSNPILRIYSEADSAGGTQNEAVLMNAGLTITNSAAATGATITQTGDDYGLSITVDVSESPHMFLTPIANATPPGSNLTEGSIYADDNGIIYYRSNTAWAAMNTAGDFSELLIPYEDRDEYDNPGDRYGYYDGVLNGGDIIIINENGRYERSTLSSDPRVVGVESGDRGSMKLEEDSADRVKGLRQIGLLGHISVNVNDHNGPIKIGDGITTSDVPGYGMKADRGDSVVGIARTSLASGSGEIEVLVSAKGSGLNTGVTVKKGKIVLSKDVDSNFGATSGLTGYWTLDDDSNLIADKAFGAEFTLDDGSKRTMFALLGDKAELMISGSDELENGQKTIYFEDVDKTFVELISHEAPFKVIITPTDDSNGMYVADKISVLNIHQEPRYVGFQIKELNNGSSDATFDWVVIATRLDYEDDPVLGCTDSTALNYDSEATEDDGSCLPAEEEGTYASVEIAGCTDETATNYNSEATEDDGSCTYEEVEVEGCTDETATNYNPDATVDDGSCTYEEVEVEGCIDETATNYNPDATVDDGSCTYEEE